jgi:hypothetical protein
MTTEKKGFFKKLFSNIKNKIMSDFITKFLAQLLEKFKAKSPKIWLALFTVATVLQFGLASVLELAIPGIDLPPELLSLDWIINTFNLEVSDTVTDWIMWLLVAITGSKAAAYLPEAQRQKALDKQAKTVEKVEKKEAKRLERAQAREARKAS